MAEVERIGRSSMGMPPALERPGSLKACKRFWIMLLVPVLTDRVSPLLGCAFCRPRQAL